MNKKATIRDSKKIVRGGTMREKSRGKPFSGTVEHLRTMPPWSGGPTAEEIIREDRDGRG